MIRRMLFCLISIVATTSFVAFGGEAEGLIVHEWGVWVRTTTDHGTMWSSPKEMVQQLPPFVRLLTKEYLPKRQNIGWQKPVIHIYGPDGLAVSVKIATPQGHPTAYFPSAALDQKTILVEDFGVPMSYSLTDCFGLQWNGTLSARPQGKLPEVDPAHWWAGVRQVPSAYFHSKDNEERFLFYEATAFQEPVVVGDVTAEELTLKLELPKGEKMAVSTGEFARVQPVLVILNDGSNRWFWSADSLTSDSPARLKKTDILRRPATDRDILGAAQSQWQSYGLTKEEAVAIVEAWKPDLLGTLGFLVISRMPTTLYEQMFPLTVTPKPTAIVRAGVVFDTLPGSQERLSWLPELRKRFEKWGQELGNENSVAREAAAAELARQGDLVRPVLEDLVQRKTGALKSEAEKLLALLKPQKVDGPLLPTSTPAEWLRSNGTHVFGGGQTRAPP